MTKLDKITITKVVPKGKKYLVTTNIEDEEFLFTENQIVNHRIITGNEFSLETWKEITNSQETSLLFDQMLHFIDFKMRTTQEVIKRLQDKKVDEIKINQIIKRLEDIGYLNDERYAQLYVEECINQNKGRYLVKYNLEQKGVKQSILDEALKKYHRDLEEELAMNVVNKYQPTIVQQPVLKQKELIAQKLSRNGFSLDIINSVLRKTTFHSDSLEMLQKDYEKLLNKKIDSNKIVTSLLQKGYRYEDIKKVLKSHN